MGGCGACIEVQCTQGVRVPCDLTCPTRTTCVTMSSPMSVAAKTSQSCWLEVSVISPIAVQTDCVSTAAVTVLVADTCAGCNSTQLNIHYLTFAHALADPALGSVQVQYRQVRLSGGFGISRKPNVSCPPESHLRTWAATECSNLREISWSRSDNNGSVLGKPHMLG